MRGSAFVIRLVVMFIQPVSVNLSRDDACSETTTTRRTFAISSDASNDRTTNNFEQTQSENNGRSASLNIGDVDVEGDSEMKSSSPIVAATVDPGAEPELGDGLPPTQKDCGDDETSETVEQDERAGSRPPSRSSLSRSRSRSSSPGGRRFRSSSPSRRSSSSRSRSNTCAETTTNRRPKPSSLVTPAASPVATSVKNIPKPGRAAALWRKAGEGRKNKDTAVKRLNKDRIKAIKKQPISNEFILSDDSSSDSEDDEAPKKNKCKDTSTAAEGRNKTTPKAKDMAEKPARARVSKVAVSDLSCKICKNGFTYKNQTQLRRHERMIHGAGKVSVKIDCSNCGKTISRNNKMPHMKTKKCLNFMK